MVGSGDDLAAAAGGEACGAESEEAEGGGFGDGACFDADAGDIFEGPFVDGDGAWVGGGLWFHGEAHPCEVFCGADVEADAEVAGVGACEGPLAVGEGWGEGHAGDVASGFCEVEEACRAVDGDACGETVSIGVSSHDLTEDTDGGADCVWGDDESLGAVTGSYGPNEELEVNSSVGVEIERVKAVVPVIRDWVSEERVAAVDVDDGGV